MEKRTRFILEGNLATREEISIEQTSDSGQRVTTSSQIKPLAAVWSELEKLNPRLDFAPGLKEGRWVASISKGNKTAVAVELPPGVREFCYRNASPSKGAYKITPGQRFQMAFPFIVLMIHYNGNAFNGVRVYYRNSTVTKSQDPLYQSTLPNIKDYDYLCTGQWAINVELSLYEKVDAVIKEFLAAEYNVDLCGNRCSPALGFKSDGEKTGKPQSVPDHPKSFEEWQERSIKDPTFVLKLNWVSAGVTLEQILRKGVE